MLMIFVIISIIILCVKFDHLDNLRAVLPNYQGKYDYISDYESVYPCNCKNVTFDNIWGMANNTECICIYTTEELPYVM